MVVVVAVAAGQGGPAARSAAKAGAPQRVAAQACMAHAGIARRRGASQYKGELGAGDEVPSGSRA